MSLCCVCLNVLAVICVSLHICSVTPQGFTGRYLQNQSWPVLRTRCFKRSPLVFRWRTGEMRAITIRYLCLYFFSLPVCVFISKAQLGRRWDLNRVQCRQHSWFISIYSAALIRTKDLTKLWSYNPRKM